MKKIFLYILLLTTVGFIKAAEITKKLDSLMNQYCYSYHDEDVHTLGYFFGGTKC
jgi:hypothetical protein